MRHAKSGNPWVSFSVALACTPDGFTAGQLAQAVEIAIWTLTIERSLRKNRAAARRRFGMIRTVRQGDISGLPPGDPAKLLRIRPYWPKLTSSNTGNRMKTLTAKDAKYGFGRLIDLARAERAVAVAKHGRPVVVVMVDPQLEAVGAIDRADKRRG